MIRANPEANLTALGLTLPQAPKPVASYIPARRAGALLFVSGQIPTRDGQLIARGRVPSQVSIEQAVECAKQCALNALASAKAAMGSLGQVRGVVRVGVFVACDAEFSDHPKIANGASDLLKAVFGDEGLHARAAVGCPSLPLGAPVEVEVVFELDPAMGLTPR